MKQNNWYIKTWETASLQKKFSNLTGSGSGRNFPMWAESSYGPSFVKLILVHVLVLVIVHVHMLMHAYSSALVLVSAVARARACFLVLVMHLHRGGRDPGHMWGIWLFRKKNWFYSRPAHRRAHGMMWLGPIPPRKKSKRPHPGTQIVSQISEKVGKEIEVKCPTYARGPSPPRPFGLNIDRCIKAFAMLVRVLGLVLTKLAFNLEHRFVTVTLWRNLPTYFMSPLCKYI